MPFDTILRNATLPDGRKGHDVAIAAGRIAAIEPRIEAEAGQQIDARGYLLSPPFVDCHFHMDATLSLGLPRLNQSGTLLEGIALWGELKLQLTHEAVAERALLRRAQPLTVPTTCIYSKSDGIVAWQCCTSLPAPETENIEVRSSHLGYGHNLQTLVVIADRLAQPENGWRPFQR